MRACLARECLRILFKAFLDDAVKIHGGVLGKHVVHRVEPMFKRYAAALRGVVNHCFDGARQTEMIELVGMQGM